MHIIARSFVYEGLSPCVCLPLQVVFEVAFNSPRGGRVAVDDISFSPEFCSTDSGELQPQSQPLLILNIQNIQKKPEAAREKCTIYLPGRWKCHSGLLVPQSRPLTPPSATVTLRQASAATPRSRGRARRGGECL